LGLPLDKRLVLFAGHRLRGNAWKDYQTVQNAITLIADRFVGQGELILIGLGDDGPPGPLGRALLFPVGYVHDRTTVARYFQAADVYLHVARIDTFPQTVLEAMACGTPVVATAVGGIPEQIDNAHTGFLVEPADIGAIVDRVMQIFTDEQLARRLADRAVASIRKSFDFRRQVDAYLEWYAELVQRGGGFASGDHRTSVWHVEDRHE
jgi:glycosyltransferase involved in cell wall biosynthesis